MTWKGTRALPRNQSCAQIQVDVIQLIQTAMADPGSCSLVPPEVPSQEGNRTDSPLGISQLPLMLDHRCRVCLWDFQFALMQAGGQQSLLAISDALFTTRFGYDTFVTTHPCV